MVMRKEGRRMAKCELYTSFFFFSSSFPKSVHLKKPREMSLFHQFIVKLSPLQLRRSASWDRQLNRNPFTFHMFFIISPATLLN